MAEYRCGECGEPMQRSRGAIPYRESGLDNVRLENVPIWKCRNGHVDAQVPAVDELHKLLAEILVMQPTPLRGQDVKFLRKFLGYTVRDMAALIGLNYVSLSKFENGRLRITRKTEALVRLFCAQALCERAGGGFPPHLIPVLEQLEKGCFEVPQDLAVEHLGLGEVQRTEPSHAWRQSRST